MPKQSKKKLAEVSAGFESNTGGGSFQKLKNLFVTDTQNEKKKKKKD